MSRLDDAIQSLREDVGGASPDAAKTLARVLAATHEERRRRRSRTYVLLAAAALVVATAAFAAIEARRSATREGLDASERTGAPLALPAIDAGPAPPDEAPAARDAKDADAAPAVERGGESDGAARATEDGATEEGAAAAAARPRPEPRAHADASAARDARELAAYTRAHRAHFEDRDPARALALWDAYLREFPGTRWEPEAKYNRALCLVRLRKIDEARRALEPFARGDYGGYRRREARALLDALEDAGP